MIFRLLRRNLWLGILAFSPAGALAQSAAPPASDSILKPQEIVLPSALPSGNAVNDRLIFTFTPARRAASQTVPGGPVPAVVLLHVLGTSRNQQMRQFAIFLANRGIASATVTLPYHMKRLPRGDLPIRHFVASDARVAVQAFNQSAADVSSVITYLQARPDVDGSKIGVVGASLGAIVTHLAMGRDARISAGVAIFGGGDLPGIYRSSILGRFVVRPRVTLTPADEALLREVDPLTFAGNNQPRRVLMIAGARDLVIPPRNAQVLWQALGNPPLRWVDVNHFGLALRPRATQLAALAYLQSVWKGAPLAEAPQIRVPALKFGLISGLDARVSPAATLQVFSLGTRRDHLSLLHANVGITGRGPFASVAATVNQFADIGIGRRLKGERFRPYISLHLAY